MTGRRADAKVLADTRKLARSTSNYNASSGPSVNSNDESPKNRQTTTSESEGDDVLPWNVFDEVGTETVLHPNTWTRELPDRIEVQ